MDFLEIRDRAVSGLDVYTLVILPRGATSGDAFSLGPVRDCRFPGLNRCVLNVIHIWVIVKWASIMTIKAYKMSSFVMRSQSGKPSN